MNEATYIQTQRSDVPYLITKITDIKVTKAGHAEFVTRPFHRFDSFVKLALTMNGILLAVFTTIVLIDIYFVHE